MSLACPAHVARRARPVSGAGKGNSPWIAVRKTDPQHWLKVTPILNDGSRGPSLDLKPLLAQFLAELTVDDH